MKLTRAAILLLASALISANCGDDEFDFHLVAEASDVSTCSDCQRFSVELPTRGTLFLFVHRQPIATLHLSDMERIEASEVGDVMQSDGSTFWLVKAVPNDSAAIDLQRLAAKNLGKRVLVTRGDTALTLDNTVAWQGPVAIAQFKTKEEAESFVSELSLPVEWVSFDEAEFERHRLDIQRLLEQQ